MENVKTVILKVPVRISVYRFVIAVISKLSVGITSNFRFRRMKAQCRFFLLLMRSYEASKNYCFDVESVANFRRSFCSHTLYICSTTIFTLCTLELLAYMNTLIMPQALFIPAQYNFVLVYTSI